MNGPARTWKEDNDGRMLAMLKKMFLSADHRGRKGPYLLFFGQVDGEK